MSLLTSLPLSVGYVQLNVNTRSEDTYLSRRFDSCFQENVTLCSRSYLFTLLFDFWWFLSSI